MYCTHCGRKLDDHAKFCPFCGTKMEKAEVVEEAARPKKRNKVVIGIVLLCVVIVAAIVLIKLGSSKEETAYIKQQSQDVSGQGEREEQSGIMDSTGDISTTEDVQSTFPYTDNASVDLSSCLTPDAYETVTSGDGSYQFAYPKYMFNSAVYENGMYTFSHDNGSGIDYQLRIYKESNPGDPVDNANVLHDRFSSILYRLSYDRVSEEEDSQGMARALVSGYFDSMDQEGVYYIAANDGTENYILEFQYYDGQADDEYKDINYVVDCIYRNCSFSGTTYRPRTFTQFQKDDMGEKK